MQRYENPKMQRFGMPLRVLFFFLFQTRRARSTQRIGFGLCRENGRSKGRTKRRIFFVYFVCSVLKTKEKEHADAPCGAENVYRLFISHHQTKLLPQPCGIIKETIYMRCRFGRPLPQLSGKFGHVSLSRVNTTVAVPLPLPNIWLQIRRLRGARGWFPSLSEGGEYAFDLFSCAVGASRQTRKGLRILRILHTDCGRHFDRIETSKQTADGVSIGSKPSYGFGTAFQSDRSLQPDCGRRFDRIETSKQTADGVSIGSKPSYGFGTAFRSGRILHTDSGQRFRSGRNLHADCERHFNRIEAFNRIAVGVSFTIESPETERNRYEL
jgi:hypothetical protein